VLVGLLLSQGLFYGLRYGLTGVLLAVMGAETPDQGWGTPYGVVLLQVAQFLSLFAGGALAAGGLQNGMMIGMLVGVCNGVLAALLRQNPSTNFTVVSLYGLPLVHAAVGALGGWLGCNIWKPLPNVPIPGLSPMRKAARKPSPSPFAGKVAWGRVFLGTGLAVGGYLSAELLLNLLLTWSPVPLSTSDEIQDLIITWEIKTLAILMGGVLAGAASPNGLKQGLVVGLLSSFCLIFWDVQRTDRKVDVAVLNMISSFCLATVGGWFGGQLLPPIGKVLSRSERFGMMS
jgi:hypothetical protein